MARIAALSCSSAGNCAVGGSYTDHAGHVQAFVVREANGTWQAATLLPGLAALNAGGNAVVSSLSCPSAGRCAAVGFYADSSDALQVLQDSQAGGTWLAAADLPGLAAADLPGLAALNTDGDAQVSSLSCTSAGNCAAGGFYADGSHQLQA